MELLQLQYVFKVQSAATDQVTVSFFAEDRSAFCRSVLYSGEVQEQIFGMGKPASRQYASELTERFLDSVSGEEP